MGLHFSMRAILILYSVFLASVVQCSIYAEDDDSSQISAPHRRPLTLADLESLDGPLLRQFLTYLQAAKDQRPADLAVDWVQVQPQILPGNLEAKFGDMTKRNYNLDHLARMNFRRSYRTGQLSTRHILGGL